MVHVRSAYESGSLGKGFYHDMVKFDLMHDGWMNMKCFSDWDVMVMVSYY